jgi:hypothetical protein
VQADDVLLEHDRQDTQEKRSDWQRSVYPFKAKPPLTAFVPSARWFLQTTLSTARFAVSQREPDRK